MNSRMGKRKTGLDLHGIALLDKRLGVSSNRALQEVKRLFNANKAGHTGSLDPLASGLLPICFGEATKVSSFMLADDKRYQVIIQLGIVTDTGDAEGSIIASKPLPVLTPQDIEKCLIDFTGPIDQVPPMYSALKHEGKKLYELARQGKTIERKARQITIYGVHLISFDGAFLELDVHCSKGTYIRTLAEDIGGYFGCGGSVKELRRTGSGCFSIQQAFTYEQFQEMTPEQLERSLKAVDLPLQELPVIYLSQEQAQSVRQGQRLRLSEPLHGVVRMYHGQDFLGLGEMLMDGRLAPKKLFNINLNLPE